MATTQTTDNLTVTDAGHHSRRADDGVDMWHDFDVQRDGHGSHRVAVRISLDGTPQEERCDCQGFRFRRSCAHIAAVYNAGMLTSYID